MSVGTGISGVDERLEERSWVGQPRRTSEPTSGHPSSFVRRPCALRSNSYSCTKYLSASPATWLLWLGPQVEELAPCARQVSQAREGVDACKCYAYRPHRDGPLRAKPSPAHYGVGKSHPSTSSLGPSPGLTSCSFYFHAPTSFGTACVPFESDSRHRAGS